MKIKSMKRAHKNSINCYCTHEQYIEKEREKDKEWKEDKREE